ncbi:AMP-binding protein [Pseudomonas sp. FP198]|uniref:AMP-binding protein n=1 Tax=Pseudomonas sp. FP198 TaxID=2954084 RepID=UPI002736A837|nr:AMP-binding protein [Pseudomonas sp. FP198]WLG93576.1 AMP-binding protein [Pseudomonas sp. FP198]
MGTLTETCDTLPHWLHRQALGHGTDVALRHKHLGVWQVRTWRQLADEVQRLASALQARGFSVGATLTIISRPTPQAIVAALAAQWLGGAASLFDPLDGVAGQVELLGELQPDFVLAEGYEELSRLGAAQVAPRVVIYLDKRGLSGSVAFDQALDYATLIEAKAFDERVPLAHAQQTAFVFYRRGPQAIEQQRISHAELLQHGQQLVQREGLRRQEEALAARGFASGDQARYLLAPWLIAGFRLNFPENLATRDRDRRELGPTLVAGTPETYERLHGYVLERLPAPGDGARSLVDWALAARPGPLRRFIGHWLVRRPLRDVLGFSRIHAPLLVGDALKPETQAFFDTLGINVRQWESAAHWEVPTISLVSTANEPDERQSQRAWKEATT